MNFCTCFLHFVFDLDVVRWAGMRCMELCRVKSVLYVRAEMKFCPYFIEFSCWMLEIFAEIIEWLCVSWKLAQRKPYFTEGLKWVSIHTLRIYWPIWVKFGVGYMYTTLLRICEFREKRCSECRSFLRGVNKMTCAREPWNRTKSRKQRTPW
jgi:hypothetical protein